MARYIDADELCSRLNECWETNDIDKGRVIQQVIDRVITPIVVGTPTADVEEVKHGEWIECSNELNKYCSVCKKVHGTIYEKPPFCENCGAKMAGKDIKVPTTDGGKEE